MTVTKTCAICARQFECGHGGPGCWCENLVVPPPQLRQIRLITDDCLCPACLAAVSAGRPSPLPEP